MSTITLSGDRPSADRKPERNAPIYVKVLVTLHILAITIWAMPLASNEVVSGRVRPHWFDVGGWLRYYNTKYLRSWPPLGVYLFETGTWQYWDMFSPNPADTDVWMDAEVIYRDGSSKFYQYPRMYKLSLPHKYAQERYRKFTERAGSTDLSFKEVWPQFGLRIAYLTDVNPANPPWTVRIYRHGLTIVPPGKPQPTEYERKLLYEYAVDQRELARMRSDP
jgi:hypothetical protein